MNSKLGCAHSTKKIHIKSTLERMIASSRAGTRVKSAILSSINRMAVPAHFYLKIYWFLFTKLFTTMTLAMSWNLICDVDYTSHEMGVCCIQSHPFNPHLVCTGRYAVLPVYLPVGSFFVTRILIQSCVGLQLRWESSPLRSSLCTYASTTTWNGRRGLEA